MSNTRAMSAECAQAPFGRCAFCKQPIGAASSCIEEKLACSACAQSHAERTFRNEVDRAVLRGAR